MDAERWRRVEELYHAARSLAGDARTRFLLQQCARDESLRSEVESLLAQSDQTWTPPHPGTAKSVDLRTAPMIGCRVGGYQVAALIGAGGMGEVDRARDAKLRRDVAIKILPREWSADPDRLARLDREARVLASLNHPNIATIHGIEDADGVRASPDVRFKTSLNQRSDSSSCR
jgi:eukaryotic-like serine/threonine-protein kinase